MATAINKTKLEELIAAARARAADEAAASKKAEADWMQAHSVRDNPKASTNSNPHPTDSMTEAQLLAIACETVSNTVELATLPASQQQLSSNGMTFNYRQTEAINLALTGASFCLIGAAGTGKTTAVRELCKQLVLADKAPLLKEDTNVLKAGTPGIVCVSFTNVAVINIARNMQGAVACQTIHSLLEFSPVTYEVIAEDGSIKNTMRFEPKRNRFNPLPAELVTIVIEEASMVGTDLFALLLDALPHANSMQFIVLGDINQLPPVYDTAILGFKMLELPIIELTEVYRQALNSPIITLAHDVKNGITHCEAGLRSPKCNVDAGEHGKLTIKPWKKKLDSFDACKLAGQFIVAAIEASEFDPDKDMVLIPFNKDFGTLEFNRYIAQHLGMKRQEVVHEVIAGFNKYYLAVGDRVLVNKRFGVITRIAKNGSYFGMQPQEASIHLNRWGFNTDTHAKKLAATAVTGSIDDIDSLLVAMNDVEDRKLQTSHLVDVRLEGREADDTLSTSSEINGMLFSYALTVHKAQGSEWRKVVCFFHQSHNVMLCRELLYTAITRAREELIVVCEPNHFTKAVQTQRIKGNTLLEKAEFFKGKQQANEAAAEAQ